MVCERLKRLVAEFCKSFYTVDALTPRVNLVGSQKVLSSHSLYLFPEKFQNLKCSVN